MSLSQATSFQVSRSICDATEKAILEAGFDGYELFVLWSGRVEGVSVHIEHMHVPHQHSYRGRSGLHVEVGGDALHELNRWLYEHGQQLVAQVHSHPTEAYHSETDDAYPMVAAIGALSIVLADFGQHGLSSPTTAVYRLSEHGWTELGSLDVNSLLQVV